MNIKVIDERIKENDQSHQNVDNTTDQGSKISLFLNTKHEIIVTSISKIPNPFSLLGGISSIQETTVQQSDSFLTNSFVHALNSQGSRRSIFTKNRIIDHVVKKGKKMRSKMIRIYH